MSKRHKIVLVNGAMGVGKSWLKNQLVAQRDYVASVSLNDGLKEVLGAITGLNLFDDTTYADFKKTIYKNGKTGREWMIMVSEESKEYHPTVWVDRFLDRVKHRTQQTLIVCDSLGFPEEWFAILAREDVETLNVYIDEGNGHAAAMQLEGEYRQFANDSRFDLSRHCSIRAANSSSALELTLKALSNRGW